MGLFWYHQKEKKKKSKIKSVFSHFYKVALKDKKSATLLCLCPKTSTMHYVEEAKAVTSHNSKWHQKSLEEPTREI